MIEKEAFNELCLHSKFKLMRKILENYIINWKVAGQNWYIVCLGSNGFIAEINPYLQNKKNKTIVNLLNCIYNSFFSLHYFDYLCLSTISFFADQQGNAPGEAAIKTD